MHEPETPLVFTWLFKLGRPILFGLLAASGLMASGRFALLIAGVCCGPLFIWSVVRLVNWCDDPRQIKFSDPDSDDPSELD